MFEQTFDSVEKMVDALSGHDSFAQGVKQRIRANQVVTELQAMRVAKGIPQSRIAQELGCSRIRVSEIENSEDADLRFSELDAYARAIDCDVHIGFAKRDVTSVEKIQAPSVACLRHQDSSD